MVFLQMSQVPPGGHFDKHQLNLMAGSISGVLPLSYRKANQHFPQRKSRILSASACRIFPGFLIIPLNKAISNHAEASG
jgi:hypothetical protein